VNSIWPGIIIAFFVFGGVEQPAMRLKKLTQQYLPSMNLHIFNRTRYAKAALLVMTAAALLFSVGCQTIPSGPAMVSAPENMVPDSSVAMREGDTLKITFPGASKLDTTQSIRRDGQITLPVLGEIKAVGLTPSELEKQILAVYGSELVTKEVNVTLESSVYSVFVNGAVVRPGKVASNRPLTALEAIMESGGFDYSRANLKTVRVIRVEQSEVKNYTLDFRGVLAGQKSDPFYLKPSDIIYVPEKFNLF
jgi:polysaccharide biosynthesis/export protein